MERVRFSRIFFVGMLLIACGTVSARVILVDDFLRAAAHEVHVHARLAHHVHAGVGVTEFEDGRFRSVRCQEHLAIVFIANGGEARGHHLAGDGHARSGAVQPVTADDHVREVAAVFLRLKIVALDRCPSFRLCSHNLEHLHIED